MLQRRSVLQLRLSGSVCWLWQHTCAPSCHDLCLLEAPDCLRCSLLCCIDIHSKPCRDATMNVSPDIAA